MRSLLSTVLTLALVVPSFAQMDLSPEEEARLLRVAEDTVLAAMTIRGNTPRISGSAVLDSNHVQVDLFYVNENDAIVPNSAERFLFDVTTRKVSSLGAPTSEVAILPVRDVLNEVQIDAIARFQRVHPGTGENVGCGVEPLVKATHTDAAGHVIVTCESFGGIAAIWMGDSISYTYTADGIFVAASQNQ